jgi:AcrR family transcriptional regulator
MDVAQAGKRLSARDWAAAALEVIGERGIAAVAVEPLAARLGTTKGSFYWHFTGRDALVRAALELWEEAHTEAVITATDEEPAPERKLHHLFTTVTSGRGEAIEVNLLAAAEHPAVAPVMQRVVQRRLDYLIGIFRATGRAEDDARIRAMFAYTAYLGSAELTIRMGVIMPRSAEAQRSFVDSVVALLLA